MHFLDDTGVSLGLADRVTAPNRSILVDAEQAIASVAAWQSGTPDRRAIPFAWFVELAIAFNPRSFWVEDVFRSVIQMVMHPAVAWGLVDEMNWDERQFHAHLPNGRVLELFEDRDGLAYVGLVR